MSKMKLKGQKFFLLIKHKATWTISKLITKICFEFVILLLTANQSTAPPATITILLFQ